MTKKTTRERKTFIISNENLIEKEKFYLSHGLLVLPFIRSNLQKLALKKTIFFQNW